MKATSLIQKLILCALGGLICALTFRRIAFRFLSFAIPNPIIIGLAGALLLASLISAFVWHRLEREGRDKSRMGAFWIGAIRYAVAFDLTMFGLQKIFHMQFTTPMAMLDEPFSSFSNQWLTWSYFGRSYAFACTIAAAQILGSMLLLINQTRLLAVIMLLPVMLNIILIDYFYELDLGVLIHALIHLGALIYLLMLDYHRLIAFFIRHQVKDARIATSRPIKLVGRLSVIVVPLLLIFIAGAPDKHPELTGKYTVTDLVVNGSRINAPTCSDSVLTLVYFDIGNDCVFEFNGQQRRMFGSYDLNLDGAISTSWHYPPEAKSKGFTGKLWITRKDEVELKGMIEGDSIRVRLQRQHGPK